MTDWLVKVVTGAGLGLVLGGVLVVAGLGGPKWAVVCTLFGTAITLALPTADGE